MSNEFQDLIDRVEATRSRIETQIDGPSVINVASARIEDGAAQLANVLAHSFTRSGHKTLLVEGSSGPVMNLGTSGVKQIDILSKIRPARQGVPDSLRLDDVGVRSLAEVRDLYAALRTRYQITITSHSLKANPGLMSLASAADIALISFKAGRAAKNEDRELAEMLRSSNAAVLGLVLMEPAALETMAAMQHNELMLVHSEQDAATVRRNAALSARVG